MSSSIHNNNNINFNFDNINLQNFPSLLNNNNEWNNTQNSVKFSIEFLYNQIINLNNKLLNIQNNFQPLESNNLKENDLNNLYQITNNISNNLKNFPTFDDMNYMINENIKKNLNEMFSNFYTKNEIENILINSDKNNCLFNELDIKFETQINNLKSDINKKLNCLPTIKDIKLLNNNLESKVNLIDLETLISKKVDKEEILNILHCKADKNDIENKLKKKIDLVEYNEIVNILNQKVNKNDFEKLNNILCNKLDKNNLTSLLENLNNKLDINEFKKFIECDYVINLEKINKKIEELDEDLDRLIERVKNQFNKVNEVLVKINDEKIDFKMFNDLKNKITDKKYFNESLNKFNFDTNEKIKLIQDGFANFSKEYKNLFDMNFKHETESTNTKLKIFEDNIEKLNEKILKAKNDTNLVNKLLNEKNNKIEFLQREFESKFNQIFDLLKLKLDIKEFNDVNLNFEKLLKCSILEKIENYANYGDLENLYNTIVMEINDKIKNDNQNLLDLIQQLNDKILLLFNEKMDKEDFQKNINEKVFSKLSETNDKSQKVFEEIENKFKNNNNDMKNKLNTEEFLNESQIINNKINEINKNIEKLPVKEEIEKLLKTKCDNIELNKIIEKIYKNLNKKLAEDVFNKFYKEQDNINYLYLTKNCFAKINFNEIKNNFIVFNEEISNTFSNNFIYEKKKSSILISFAGIYNIKINLFNNDSNSNLSLILNGEKIITKCSNKLAFNNNNLIQSNIIIDEVISIKNKTRVTLEFKGEEKNLKGIIEIYCLEINKNENK